MAFLRRIKQSDLENLAKQFQRSYFQIHSSFRISNSSTSYSKSSVLDYPSSSIQNFQFELSSNFRFFAAPVQFQKRDEKDDGPRLNNQITAGVVRLVTEEGHFVVPKQEALKRARNLKLDLVEVQRNAKPPVCKIMDYLKEKYQLEQKEKDRAKSKSEGSLRTGSCKEIRFAGNITQKDLEIKVDTAKRLMERGYRVKCQAKGNKGEDSATLLSRICALIEDVSVVESDTRVEDKDQAHIIVRHIKYGPTKKGSVKKGSTGNKVTASAQEGESDTDVLCEEEHDDSGKKETSSYANDDFNKRSSAVEQSSSSGVSSRYPSPLNRPDSARTPAASVVGTENRYMKDPRNNSRVRSPTDPSFNGERNNAQLRPQFPGSGGRSQLNANSSPIKRETAHGENESSRFSNMSRPEQSSSPVPSSPPKNYGVFNQVDNAPGRSDLPAENNRYKQRNPSEPVGHTERRAGANPSRF